MWDSESSWLRSSSGCSEGMGGGGRSDSSTGGKKSHLLKEKKQKKHPMSQCVCKRTLSHRSIWIVADTDES